MYTQFAHQISFRQIKFQAQFEHSSSLLSSLDNVTIEEDGETERGSFIAANIEIIAKICVLKPMDILGSLLPSLRSQVEEFINGTNKVWFFLDSVRQFGTCIYELSEILAHDITFQATWHCRAVFSIFDVFWRKTHSFW